MARKTDLPEGYVEDNITFENAQLRFLNFTGREQKFNPEGRRNFCVLLDEEFGTRLEADGWNVKWFPVDEETPEDPVTGYLQVAVSFKQRPPRIIMLTNEGRNRTLLDEHSVSVLDTAEIKTVDLIIKPYNWEVNGKTGVKAYLKTMYVTLLEDELDLKYQEEFDSPAASIYDGEEYEE